MINPEEKQRTPLTEGVVLLSDRYRAWIDTRNTGHIRVIKRINFSTIITVVQKMVEIQRDKSGESGLIQIYIPNSLRTIHSENLRSFISFTNGCCNISIKVIESE
jgi:hypothetical protein